MYALGWRQDPFLSALPVFSGLVNEAVSEPIRPQWGPDGTPEGSPPLVVHWICLYLLLFNPSREEPSASINQVQGDLCSAGKPWYPVLQVLLAASADAQGCSSPANSIRGASKVSDVMPWEISRPSPYILHGRLQGTESYTVRNGAS